MRESLNHLACGPTVLLKCNDGSCYKICLWRLFRQVHVLFLQVNLTIEEHTRELLALNRKFGVTLLDAVTLLQESDSFLECVKVGIEEAINYCIRS